MVVKVVYLRPRRLHQREESGLRMGRRALLARRPERSDLARLRRDNEG